VPGLFRRFAGNVLFHDVPDAALAIALHIAGLLVVVVTIEQLAFIRPHIGILISVAVDFLIFDITLGVSFVIIVVFREAATNHINISISV